MPYAAFFRPISTFKTSLNTTPALGVLKSGNLPSVNDFFIEAEFGLPVFEDDEEMDAVYKLSAPPLSYIPDEVDLSDKPLIHVLCGFLGSGKTLFCKIGSISFTHENVLPVSFRTNLVKSI